MEGLTQHGSRRRAKEQMGEGFYISIDESNGGESPKKRARTGSLSDHGTYITLMPGDKTSADLM